jgi:hypothetical protein
MRKVAIAAGALAGGGVLGLLAGHFEPVRNYAWVTALALGIVGFLGIIALGRVLAVGRTADPMVARIENEQSVEQSWIRRASSAAFFDLVVIVSVTAVFFSITRLEVPIQLVLGAVAAVALADLGVRRTLLARRES